MLSHTLNLYNGQKPLFLKLVVKVMNAGVNTRMTRTVPLGSYSICLGFMINIWWEGPIGTSRQKTMSLTRR